MEASSSVVMRPNPCLSRGDAGIDAHFHRNSFYYLPSSSYQKTCMTMGMGFSSSSSSSALVGRRGYRRKHLNVGFYDKGQFDHYYYYFYYDNNKSSSSIRCGGGGAGKKEKIKDKGKEEKKMMKKRLKLLKGLSKDLSVFSQMMGFELGSDRSASLADQVKADNMSEAAGLLLLQLQKLRAEEKELKTKRKQEKIQIRAAQLHNRFGCDMSSGSSSESSDSECDEEEVVYIKSLKCGSLAQPISIANQPLIEKETNISSSISTQESIMSLLHPPPLTSESIRPCSEDHLQDSNSTVGKDDQVCSSNSSLREREQEPECCTGANKCNKIEVCMGGKCKKSGAASLIEEFQKVVGVDVAVSGCKCMGKCKDGPNVRVVNNNSIDDCDRTPSSPLCIGVGLEDVGLIVANFFGGDQNEIGLPAAP